MSTPTAPITVVNNPEAKRFEVQLDEGLAMAQYMLAREKIVFTHTEVPPSMEGMGVGSALARTGLDYARAEGLTVIPLCPFIAAFIRRHPAYQDLVMRGYRY